MADSIHSLATRLPPLPHLATYHGRAPRTAAFALCLAGLVSAACESPTEPERFEILSPTADLVSVVPGGTVRFEVRLDPGFEAQFVVDGRAVEPGPLFLFRPEGPEHTVTALVKSTSPAATVLQKEFSIVVEVPGNLPPEVVSLTATDNREAERDTVRAQAIVQDPDGSVGKITLDFGDGSPATLQNGKSTSIQGEHVYDAPGLYWVKVTVTDSVQIARSDSTRITVLPPNQLPVGDLTVQGSREGEAPLQVTLVTAGVDPDGSIVKWEIDPEGDGQFRTIQPLERVAVSYEFSETSYRPALRLTDDDGDSAVIESDAEIKVFRAISAGQSSTQAFGNPALSANGRVFIWADGQDRLTVNVDVRDPSGNPLDDVPVRVTSLRPNLIAPDDRTDLGQAVDILPGSIVRTAGDGRATAFLSSRTSTRVEAVPEIASNPFAVRIEASRGHGEWVELDVIDGIETETIVDARQGQIVTTKAGGGGYCPGDTIEIRVRAFRRATAPGNGSPRGMYTQIRWGQFSNPAWFGTLPAPGYSDWRTDSNGEVVFRYVPTEADGNRIIVAWVDGNALVNLGTLNFKAGC